MTRPLVLLAGCARLPDGDGDERTVLPALEDAGLRARWACWTDQDAGFAAADLVVLRATWDYSARRAEFLRWCARVGNLRNRVEVVRWNTDKAYLAELASVGIATVPTELVPPGRLPAWPSAEFVLKPAVGAGSVGAARFAAGSDREPAEHLAALHARGHTALLQPYQARVDTEGETALVSFAGAYSHAFTKGPMLTGAAADDSGLYVSERLGLTEPEPAYRALAEDALDAAVQLLRIRRDELLYARVDVVRADDGKPALLELELTEPSLGFRHADPGAPARFAEAVRAQVSASR